MKNNIKKGRYGINIFLAMILIFISISTGQATVSVSRTINNSTVMVGGTTNATVIINDVTQALALKETIPSGWNLTKISDDADLFKASTNEWVWFAATGNSVKTVIYKITVPFDTIPGTYNITGNVVTNASTTNITGNNTIQVIGQSNTDVVPPTTKINGVIQGNTYNDNITITLTAIDNSGGSGVNNTLYSVNEGQNITYTGPFTVSDLGPNILKYWSIDKVGNVEPINTIDFTINQTPINPTTSFKFIVDQSNYTINVGQIAQYNLTISNTGTVTDTYNIVTNQSNNATVSLTKNSININPGNDSMIGLNVNSSTTGTYTIHITATSKTDSNISKIVTITTNVIATVITSNTDSNGNSVSVSGSSIGGEGGGGGGGGGGSSSGGGVGGGDGGGNVTTTKQNQINTTNAMVISATKNTVIPVETTTTQNTEGQGKPIDTDNKVAPGFELFIAIGVIIAIFVTRKI